MVIDHSGAARSPISPSFEQLQLSLTPNATPLASSGPVSLFIRLAEPILFLRGFEQDGGTQQTPAMLRGSLIVRVLKATKLRAISLSFVGRSRTEWPEVLPPPQQETCEEETLVSHTWPFFHAQWAASQTNASRVRRFKTSQDCQAQERTYPYANSRKIRDIKRASVHLTATSLHNHLPSTVLSGGDYDRTAQNTGYLIFQPGEYFYDFEHPVHSRMPETCRLDAGSIRYSLEATIERAGTWTTNLKAAREVELIRYPSDPSLEQAEPIAISRSWEDQLHYEVVVSGKTFSLGSIIPIAIKLTPLDKVQIHRIRVIVTEHVSYHARRQTVHRHEPSRTVQLLEKRAGGPLLCAYRGSSLRVLSGGGVDYNHRQAAARGQDVLASGPSILGDLMLEENLGPTEMELGARLPPCTAVAPIHPTMNCKIIEVTHWIKLLLRISRPDQAAPSKRRHYEISIDSPIHIMSCRAAPQNLSLPAYGTSDDHGLQHECACRAMSESLLQPHHHAAPLSVTPVGGGPQGLANQAPGGHTPAQSQHGPEIRPGPAVGHNQPSPARPIHLLRYPSFAPPPWHAEEPPPLMTPPPGYDQSVIGRGGLTDYFSRLADEDEGDERLQSWHRGTGRVGIPLTPGGRVSHSLDILR